MLVHALWGIANRSKTSARPRTPSSTSRPTVASIPDLDVDWYPLANLVDAALAIDDRNAKAYRQRLTDVPPCEGPTQLICHAALFEGHALLR